MGRTDVLTRRDYEASLGWIRHFFNESEMAPQPECIAVVCSKLLDTAGIVRDAIYSQLRAMVPVSGVLTTQSEPALRDFRSALTRKQPPRSLVKNEEAVVWS